MEEAHANVIVEPDPHRGSPCQLVKNDTR
jgi:hypothetical protein